MNTRKLLLFGPDSCGRLSWKWIGANYWPDYRSCIKATIRQAGTDTVSTFGSLSGTAKWIGGVLAPNGAIYGIPLSSTTVLKIQPDSPIALMLQVILSAYFNKL